jgi:hypothetical protein
MVNLELQRSTVWFGFDPGGSSVGPTASVPPNAGSSDWHSVNSLICLQIGVGFGPASIISIA